MDDKKQEKIPHPKSFQQKLIYGEKSTDSHRSYSPFCYTFSSYHPLYPPSVTKQPTESHWHRRLPGDFNCSLPKWLSFRRSCQSSFHNQFLNVARWTPKVPAARYVGEIIKWLRRVSKEDSRCACKKSRWSAVWHLLTIVYVCTCGWAFIHFNLFW